MWQRRTFLKSVLGAGAVLMLPLRGAAQTPLRTLRLGAVFNLSGAGATDEALLRDGAALRVVLFNESGGPFALELLVEDGQTSPAGAAEAANRLANRGDLSAVLGPLIGNQALATQPIFAAAQIPQIAFAGEAQFTDAHAQAPLSLRLGFQVPAQTAPLLKFGVEARGQTRWFVLGQDTGFGHDVAAAVGAQLALLGRGALAGEPEFYPFLNTDFSTLMTKALATGADAVLLGTGVPLEIIAAAREFARQASEGVGFYAQHTPSTLSPVTSGYASLRDAVPADRLTFGWFYDGSQPRAFPRLASDAVRTLEDAVAQRLGRPASAMEGWGWGAVEVVAQALGALVDAEGAEAVAALDPVAELPPKLVATALDGRPFETPFGRARFLPCGQFDQQEGVATFRDGEVFLLEDRGYAAELVAAPCP